MSLLSSGVDDSVELASSEPTRNSAACASACSRNSRISSTLPSVFSCFRWFLRSALSRCFCCRACSFCRLVNVDRPLGIHNPPCVFVDLWLAICSVRQFQEAGASYLLGCRGGRGWPG